MSTKLRKQLLLVIILFLMSYSLNLGNFGLRAYATTWNTTYTGFGSTSDNSVVYGEGQWLLFSGYGEYGKSLNGTEWKRANMSFECSPSPVSPTAFYWEENTMPKWVVACFKGDIYTLKEGIDPIVDSNQWISRTSGNNFTLNSFASSKDKIVAVGDAGTILTSADAENWDNYSPGNVAIFNSVTYGEGKFIAVGRGNDNSSVIYSSVDGERWTKVNTAIRLISFLVLHMGLESLFRWG
ncbi:hypothetical protein [Metabacillus endolithicus]|uniref:hypothetical protein n=1 Tax=Metabacillus endolithicus TaxID=1535204 RepID=UPI001FFBD327|nr:hypothetical protein [Metabacillus endolithicus]UPG65521.1 hypothetical protein MVE64_11430 [Metabacillus endolithicus]